MLLPPSGLPITFGYDALNRRTSRTVPNAVDTALAFDDASRLTDIDHVLAAVTVAGFT